MLNLTANFMLRQSGGSAFNPNSISGLVGWYDLSDASTLTLSGSNITNIASKALSGIGNMVQATAGRQGTNTGTIGGRAAMAMTGGAQHYVGAASATIGTTFVVASAASDPSTPPAFAGLLSNGNGADTRNIRFEQGTTPAGVVLSSPDYADLTTSRLNDTVDITNKVVPRAAFLLTANPTATFSMAPAISQANIGLNRGWNGAVGEILFYNSILNATQIATVESYLRTKWGMVKPVTYFNGATDVLRWLSNLGITDNQKLTIIIDTVTAARPSGSSFPQLIGFTRNSGGALWYRLYRTTVNNDRYYGDLFNLSSTNINAHASASSGSFFINGNRQTAAISMDQASASDITRMFTNNTSSFVSTGFTTGSNSGAKGGANYRAEFMANGAAGNLAQGWVRALWVADAYWNLDDNAERAKFLNGDGELRDLGSGVVDGVTPRIYMRGHDFTTGANLGSAGAATVVGAPTAGFIV